MTSQGSDPGDFPLPVQLDKAQSIGSQAHAAHIKRGKISDFQSACQPSHDAISIGPILCKSNMVRNMSSVRLRVKVEFVLHSSRRSLASDDFV